MIYSRKYIYAAILAAAVPLSSIILAETIVDPRSLDAPSSEKERAALFLHKIHLIDQAEIKIGKMAITKAKGGAARSYAAMLVKDHSMSETKVMSAARRDDIKLDSAKDERSSKELQEKLDKKYTDLESKSKADFDSAFSEMMVTGHGEAIDLVNTEGKALSSPAIKQLISELLPSLQHHQDEALSFQVAVR